MIKKIFTFVMFILPFTKSKVQQAQVVLEGVDAALNVLQNQQGKVIAGVNATLEDLMIKKAEALAEIEKANGLRKQIIDSVKQM